MTSSATADLQIASVRRQFVAATIDMVSILGSLTLLVGGGVWAYSRFGPESSASADPAACTSGSCDRRGVPKTVIYALSGAMLIPGVKLRNSRTPGSRIMRTRRVDARTGGRVSVRSAVASGAADLGWSWLMGRAFAPLQQRAAERVKAKLDLAQEEIAELRRQHPDDPETLQREMMAVYKRHKVGSLRSCLPSVARTILTAYVPKHLSPRNQSVPDRLAGIVTVVER